jgi:hypothetical protein
MNRPKFLRGENQEVHISTNMPILQYNETNVMHFLFNLLRSKDLYMFRALVAHPQEVLHKRHVVYCVCYVSWLLSGLEWNWHNTHIPSAACSELPEDEQVMLETCRGP